MMREREIERERERERVGVFKLSQGLARNMRIQNAPKSHKDEFHSHHVRNWLNKTFRYPLGENQFVAQSIVALLLDASWCHKDSWFLTSRSQCHKQNAELKHFGLDVKSLMTIFSQSECIIPPGFTIAVKCIKKYAKYLIWRFQFWPNSEPFINHLHHIVLFQKPCNLHQNCPVLSQIPCACCSVANLFFLFF